MIRTLHHPAHVPSCLLAALASLLAFAGSALAVQSGTSPVKIFIMAGQSNMLGKGTISPVDHAGNAGLHRGERPRGQIPVPEKRWQLCGARRCLDSGSGSSAGGLTVGFGGEAAGLIGPELGFGHKMGDVDESQILIVKCAWGGKDLAYNFCPPSSRIGEPATRDLRRQGILLQGNPAAGERGQNQSRHLFSRLQRRGLPNRRHVLAPGMERPHRCRQECRLSDEHGELHQRHPQRPGGCPTCPSSSPPPAWTDSAATATPGRKGAVEDGRYDGLSGLRRQRGGRRHARHLRRISISGSRCRLPRRTRTITGTKTPRPISISVLPWVTRCP